MPNRGYALNKGCNESHVHERAVQRWRKVLEIGGGGGGTDDGACISTHMLGWVGGGGGGGMFPLPKIKCSEIASEVIFVHECH